MKDTILFELEYDKDGNPDIRITMNTAKKGRRVYMLNECRVPDFEELPDIIQVETLYRLAVRIYENYDEAEQEIITSERNAQNKRKIKDPAVMKRYAEIVNERQRIRPGKFWKQAFKECEEYSQKLDDKTSYLIVSKMELEDFRAMMTHYMNNPPL